MSARKVCRYYRWCTTLSLFIFLSYSCHDIMELTIPKRNCMIKTITTDGSQNLIHETFLIGKRLYLQPESLTFFVYVTLAISSFHPHLSVCSALRIGMVKSSKQTLSPGTAYRRTLLSSDRLIDNHTIKRKCWEGKCVLKLHI